MAFRKSKRLENAVEIVRKRPWEIAIAPFQVSPQTYYVAGQSWVGCYLIDTGDGLILIDTAQVETLYMMIDSIYALGYNPRDIKKILISHAHFDHCGAAAAMKQLTGAELYMSKEDAEFMEKCPEETLCLGEGILAQEFKPDYYYEEGEAITLGNIAIHTKLTPGHTIGTTSYFWEETNPVTGQVYRIAMHGGVGPNTMNDEYYARSQYLTPDLRERFLADCEEMKSIPVDIALPSHPNQIEIVDRAGQYTHESQPYYDDTVWADYLEDRAEQVRRLMR